MARVGEEPQLQPPSCEQPQEGLADGLPPGEQPQQSFADDLVKGPTKDKDEEFYNALDEVTGPEAGDHEVEPQEQPQLSPQEQPQEGPADDLEQPPEPPQLLSGQPKLQKMTPGPPTS